MKWSVVWMGLLLMLPGHGMAWGFYAHRLINYQAVFLLPPEMLVLYKPNIDFLSEHAVDPDKRRYAVLEEGPRHYIDLDRYGDGRYDLPFRWADAVERFSADTLMAHGIVPWWIQTMMQRLIRAFREKDQVRILKLSADLGHYIGDSHVPLHACSNHNGQFTGQQGIHGFWESRIPELMAERHWDLLIGRAALIADPVKYCWERVFESGRAADTVLAYEKILGDSLPHDRKYAFENRNGVIIKQYSTEYCVAYNNMLDNMIERRLRESIYAVASFWYTAWVKAGQPDLRTLENRSFSEQDLQNFEDLNQKWRNESLKGRPCSRSGYEGLHSPEAVCFSRTAACSRPGYEILLWQQSLVTSHGMRYGDNLPGTINIFPIRSARRASFQRIPSG